MVVMPLGHKQRAAERRPGLGTVSSYFFAALSTARAPERAASFTSLRGYAQRLWPYPACLRVLYGALCFVSSALQVFLVHGFLLGMGYANAGEGTRFPNAPRLGGLLSPVLRTEAFTLGNKAVAARPATSFNLG